MSDTLRPYGPGKFNTILDSLVYDLSLDGGPDEETGDVSETGTWYGLLRGSVEISADVLSVAGETLTDSEKAFLSRQLGAILSENDQGFVSVEYFESAEELELSWSVLSAEAYEADEADDATEYEVLADNIGSVYSGTDATEAEQTYQTYVTKCQNQDGRIGGSVTLMKDGEPSKEFSRESAEAEAQA